MRAGSALRPVGVPLCSASGDAAPTHLATEAQGYTIIADMGGAPDLAGVRLGRVFLPANSSYRVP